MRWCRLPLFALAVLAVLAGPADAEEIGAVLVRSQNMRLASFQPASADGADAAVVRRSFERLQAQLRDLPADLPPIELRVVSGPVLAETLLGTVVVANESLAALPEAERLFVLAHELGHVARRHWCAFGALYQRWIPGEVVPANTEPVARALGREASALAHRHEFEADAFAFDLLQQMGHAPEAALSTFTRLGATYDTATHPGTHRRLQQLRRQLAHAQ